MNDKTCGECKMFKKPDFVLLDYEKEYGKCLFEDAPEWIIEEIRKVDIYHKSKACKFFKAASE